MTPFPGDPSASPSTAVKDVNTETFAADVIEASKKVPIVVDFWAPWCGPCKQLTPILEKVIGESAGRVQMVKINIDESPQIAGQLGVKSIPAVFGFSDGRPVDGFMGVIPESQVRHFVEKLGGTSSAGADEILAAAATALEAGETKEAGQMYREVLSTDPRDTRAIAGLSRCSISVKDFDAAQEILDLAPEDKLTDSEITSAHAALQLARSAGNVASELIPLQAQVAADPSNHRARIDYAIALNAASQREDALDQLIESIRLNHDWEDGAARQQLLTFFEAWGLSDPLSANGRRKLSSILFS